MTCPAPGVKLRRRAVELAGLSENSVSAIAKDLEISELCLRNWLAQTGTDGGGTGDRAVVGTTVLGARRGTDRAVHTLERVVPALLAAAAVTNVRR